MKPISSPQNQGQDQEIIEILKGLDSSNAEYPSDLLAARRAAFIAQVRQYSKDSVREEQSSEDQFIKQLQGLRSVSVEYPRELLTARRAAFIAQVEQHSGVEVKEELFAEDQSIIRLFKSIKAIEPEYPPNLMAARRAAFKRQLALGSSVSLLEALRSSIERLFLDKVKPLSVPTMNMMRTSLTIAILMMATFVGALLGNRRPVFNPSPTQAEVAQPGSAPATSTGEVAEVICKPGYLPPLCLAKEFDKSEDLTFSGNGAARPAVAKDTLPGYSGVHQAAYVNDGLYGPGSSWVSNSAYSWIKIDLGKATTINTVTFGRDRLGNFNDRNPGRFVIAVALSDDIYADGNSNNDYVEYTQIYNSDQTGFNGVVSGPETIKASFGPVMARFVKIVFTNAGTAVDEVEVFMAQPPVIAGHPTKERDEDVPGVYSPPVSVNTPRPINTPIPPTPIPPTPIPPTPIPPTPIPPTPVPPTPIPPTPLPPPTDIPPTEVPPTEVPPPTDVPPTEAPQPTGVAPVDTPIVLQADTVEPAVISTGTADAGIDS